MARVYEAGSTEEGQPYFLMEYVPGVPITAHCNANRLSVADRLRLFIQVCEGVQHAHDRGHIQVCAPTLATSSFCARWVSLIDPAWPPKCYCGAGESPSPRFQPERHQYLSDFLRLFTSQAWLMDHTEDASSTLEETQLKARSVFSRFALLALGLLPLHLAAQAPIVSPTSIALNAPTNSFTAVSQTFTITGTPGETWRVQAVGGFWLRFLLAPTCPGSVVDCTSSTAGSNTVTVVANPTGLIPFNYSGSITISYPGGVLTVPVSFSVGGMASSNFTATPTSLSFTATPGGASQSQPVAIGSTGTPNSVFFATTTNASWLTTSLGGSSVFAPASLTVIANPANLAAGTYQGTVTFTPAGNTAPPINVPVTFTVSAGQQLVVNPTTVTFNSAGGQLSLPVSIGVNSGANVPFTVSISYPGLVALRWLSTNVTSGTTGTSIILSATGASTLAAGEYAATVSISSPGLTTVNIPASLSTSAGSAGPRLVVDSSPITIAVPPAGTGTRTLTLSTSTGTNIPYTVSVQYTSPQNPAVNWLGLTNAAGTTPSPVSINAGAGTLPAGTYSANLIITSTGFAALTVPVTMTVTGSQILTSSPSTLSFAYLGGSPPTSQNILLGLNPATPAQPATVSTFYDVAGQSWLTVVLASSTPGSITTGTLVGVGVNVAGLGNGTYTARVRIQVTGGGVSNSLVDIPVTLTISGIAGGGNPTVLFSPAQLSFSSILNGAVLDQNLTLTTNISPAVTYLLSTNTSWITVLASSGTTPGTAFIRVNPAGLAAGTYSGSVTLNAIGAANNGVTVPVSLTISSSSQSLVLNPNSLSFVAQANGAPPPAKNVSVGSTVASTAYSVTSNQTWLQGIAGTDSTPGAIAVYVNPGSLSPGTYNGNLTVSSSSFSANLPVTLEITSGPLLRLSQQTLTFNYQSGQAIPNARTILVSSSSGGVPTASILAATASGGNWLVVTPASLQTPGAFAVSLAANVVAALAPGSHAGTVTVSAPGVPSATLNVNLNIGATALLTMSTATAAFSAEINGSLPISQSRPVTSTSPSPLAVTAAVSANTVWLTASLNINVTPATLTIQAFPLGLSPGTYAGSVTVSSGSSGTVSTGANVLVVPVTLTVSALPAISVDKPELIFGGDNNSALPQGVQVTSTSSSLTYNVSTTVINSPVQWLTVTPNFGNTPSSVSVSANGANLSNGTYSGTVTFTPQSAGAVPVVIPVTLIVNQSVVLQVTPTTLSFTQIRGASPAGAQTVQVTSQQPVTYTFTSAVQSPVNGNWLNVVQSSGQTNGILQVSPNGNAAALPAGNYTAVISVFSPNASGNVLISVNLAVVAQNNLLVAPSSVNFAGRLSQGNPPPQTVQVNASVPGIPLSFSVTSDVPWLNVTPLAGTTPTTLNIGVNTAALPGNSPVAVGRLTLVPLTGGQTTTITVNYLVEPAPPPAMTTFANAATFQPGALSPGMIFTILGTDLGPAQAVSGQVINGRFTTAVSGVRVLFDGIPAPILFASATQINATVPYQLTGRAFAQMTVEYNGVASNSLAPRIVDSAPGIFTTDGRQAAALNADGTVNSPGNPAAAGNIVVLFATGEGQTSPGGVDGELVAATNLKRPMGQVRVRVNGADIPATEIFYAGSAPSLVSGLMQINFRLSANAPANSSTPVEIFVGAGQSPVGTTIAVR